MEKYQMGLKWLCIQKTQYVCLYASQSHLTSVKCLRLRVFLSHTLDKCFLFIFSLIQYATILVELSMAWYDADWNDVWHTNTQRMNRAYKQNNNRTRDLVQKRRIKYSILYWMEYKILSADRLQHETRIFVCNNITSNNEAVRSNMKV